LSLEVASVEIAVKAKAITIVDRFYIQPMIKEGILL